MYYLILCLILSVPSISLADPSDSQVISAFEEANKELQEQRQQEAEPQWRALDAKILPKTAQLRKTLGIKKAQPTRQLSQSLVIAYQMCETTQDILNNNMEIKELISQWKNFGIASPERLELLKWRATSYPEKLLEESLIFQRLAGTKFNLRRCKMIDAFIHSNKERAMKGPV